MPMDLVCGAAKMSQQIQDVLRLHKHSFPQIVLPAQRS